MLLSELNVTYSRPVNCEKYVAWCDAKLCQPSLQLSPTSGRELERGQLTQLNCHASGKSKTTLCYGRLVIAGTAAVKIGADWPI